MASAMIEDLWRSYLHDFAETRIKDELQSRWGDDPNVVQGRIQFSYPPTFQPGYVGSQFGESGTRILFIGYNPGEGKQQSSQDDDKILAIQLSAFADGKLSFQQFNDFLSSHLVKWPIYREKGVLSETGDSRIALIPNIYAHPSVRWRY